ncbi:hypothetical protein MHSWG343_04670 [Candidatus Mycoplasma haematohominis]|uniref:Lipoprotein n=1 Tax=Candidatus Mycoplasma haematohominis TaxID=1494318 RepID=A0A478FTW1_9MOLU|nr:hypothetical protein MHSWG343_04670 [Candidatus Mycoplasma haemohominis]
MDPIKSSAAAAFTLFTVAGACGTSNFLSIPSVYIQTPIEGKFGSDFQFHLLDASSGNNDYLWRNRFIKYLKTFKSDLSTRFREIVTAFNFHKVSFEDLKKACKEAYTEKVTRTDIHPETKDRDKSLYEKNIWTFCSIHEHKPLTIEEQRDVSDNQYEGKLGGTKKSLLVSVREEVNQKFWEIQAQAFYKRKDKNGSIIDGLGQKAKNALKFKELYEKQKIEEQTVEAFKQVCENSYGEVSDNNKDKEVLLFCSLQGTQEQKSK